MREVDISKKENNAIRNYIDYIEVRLKFLNIDLAISNGNEKCFYETLLKRIKKWGSNHRIYYSYLLSKIDMYEVAKYFGASRNTACRMLKVQRKNLLSSISRWEIELGEQYPFDMVEGYENLGD